MAYKIVTLKKTRILSYKSKGENDKLIFQQLHRILSLPENRNYDWETLAERAKNHLIALYNESSEKVFIERLLIDKNSNLKFWSSEIEKAKHFFGREKDSTYQISQTSISYTLIDNFGDKVLLSEEEYKENNAIFKNTFIVQLSEDLYINTYKENE